jgi:anti-anti-sigma regulatory factor
MKLLRNWTHQWPFPEHLGLPPAMMMALANWLMCWTAPRLLVNAEEISDVDTTGADQLIKLKQDLTKLSIRFSLAHVKGVVLDLLEVTGAVEVIGAENIFESVQDGIDALLDQASQTES